MNLDAGFGSLCAIIEREIDLQGQLLAVAERQQAALTAGQTQALNEIADEQWRLLRRAAALDRRLAAAVERLARAHEHSDATLAAVAALAPEPMRTRLRQLVGRLSEVADRVQRTGRINAALADNALGLIDFSLRAIVGSAAQDVTYSPPGKEAERAGGTLLLNARV